MVRHNKLYLCTCSRCGDCVQSDVLLSVRCDQYDVCVCVCVCVCVSSLMFSCPRDVGLIAVARRQVAGQGTDELSLSSYVLLSSCLTLDSHADSNVESIVFISF